MNFDTVKKLALALAGVEESGPSALKARGKLFAFLPTHKSAEPGTLAVRVSIDQREGLIADAPDIYYVTHHYLNYPTVLVRMSRIKRDALKDLLSMAWSFDGRR